MKRKWNSRPYREGDEEGIFSLFYSDKGEPSFRDREWWKWRHLNNPVGKAVMWVAEADGEIVSNLAAVPLKTKQFSETVIIARGGDGKTRPEFRGQGIFTNLMRNIIHEGTEKSWSFFLSMPSKQLHPILLKLGWLDMRKLPKLIKILNTQKVSEVIRDEKGRGKGILTRFIGTFSQLRSPRNNTIYLKDRIYIKQEKYFNKAYDIFWEKISQELGVAVVRDSEYLNWRYRDNPIYQSPKNKYTVFSIKNDERIMGFTVLGCYHEKFHVGRILEFMFLREQPLAAEILLTTANRYFIEQGADIIMTLKQNPYLSKKVFRKYGYFRQPFDETNFAIKIMASKMDGKLLTNEDDWLLTWGESGMI